MNIRQAGTACLVLLCLCTRVMAVEIFTSSRQVTALACEPDGTLWAATKGGVLQRKPDGIWHKFTQLDGLPSNEILRISVDKGIVTATTPEAAARFIDGQWRTDTSLTQSSGGAQQQTASAVWNGRECIATITDLRIKEKDKWRVVPFPPGRGTHISALLAHGSNLWAAMFGDGIWEYNGKSWARADSYLPSAAREITCMIDTGSSIWIGTRHEGLWQYDGKRWPQFLMPDEPYDHNCQSIITYEGDLYVTTLEEGLVVKTAKGWIRYSDKMLSSNAPRQMAVFDRCLYLRNGNGKVDRFDGKTWTKNIFPALPRKQASALASNNTRLYVAQWGGWSEFDGKTWKHNLTVPELQGYAITVIYLYGNTLWIGTQGRGLAEFNTISRKLTWHDESNGMPDDWIKVIAQSSQLLVGTFVGGLTCWDGIKWTSANGFSNTEITAIAPEFAGMGAYIGTRNGLFYRKRNGEIVPVVSNNTQISYEVQALESTYQKIWLGTRTGLYLLPVPLKN